MRQSAWQTAMGILLLCIVALISWQAGTLAVVQSQNVRQASEKRTKYRIVLDAGHGGTQLRK